MNLGPRWSSGRLASRAKRQYYLVNCLTIFSMFAKRAEMEPRKPTTAATADAMLVNFSTGPVSSSQPKILEEPVASGVSSGLVVSLPSFSFSSSGSGVNSFLSWMREPNVPASEEILICSWFPLSDGDAVG